MWKVVGLFVTELFQKISIPLPWRVFCLNPPPSGKFQFGFILSVKKILAFEIPSSLEFPKILLGVGIDISWTHIHHLILVGYRKYFTQT